MIPHDYYDGHGHMHMHNMGGGRPYLEPDFHATGHGDQLPAISSIGRGPRGEGVTVGNVVETDDTVKFTLVSMLTGETLWESPNLAPLDLAVTALDWDDVAAGTPLPVRFTVKRGGTSKTTTLYFPPGQPGSTLHIASGIKDRTADDTYLLPVSGISGDAASGAQLRAGDTVAFQYADEEHVGPDGISGVAFGFVAYLGDEQATVVAKMYVPCGKGEPGDFEDLTPDQVAQLTADVTAGLPFISPELVDAIWDAVQ